jgi:ComF family protein
MQYSQRLKACQPALRRAVDKGRALAHALFPPVCLLCRGRGQVLDGSERVDLCRSCEIELPWNATACRVCALPLAASEAAGDACATCIQRPPPYSASTAPLRYAYPLDHLVHGLKFRRELACGRMLGQLLAHYIVANRREPLPQMIIPVPLAPRRFRERGFNQACELGLPLARILRVPMRADVAIRQRETLEQLPLDRKQRRRNVRDAFAAPAPLPAGHVAILDDVVTTGSTVTELARVLAGAGAERIEVWAIARAGSERDDAQRKMYSSAMPTNTAMPK